MEEETTEKRFQRMCKFIDKGQIITQLSSGNYMIFSARFNMITVMSISKGKYIDFWASNTMWLKDKTHQEMIKQVCEDKLENGLITKEEMIELVTKSNDREKEEALKLLKRKKKKGLVV